MGVVKADVKIRYRILRQVVLASLMACPIGSGAEQQRKGVSQITVGL
jgi:hypothetical protein